MFLCGNAGSQAQLQRQEACFAEQHETCLCKVWEDVDVSANSFENILASANLSMFILNLKQGERFCAHPLNVSELDMTQCTACSEQAPTTAHPSLQISGRAMQWPV
ncbi:hypothetical protein WJX77_012325 [Trebouxia sp. C0004]